MDHSMPGMDHGDHGGHDGMDMGGKCSMNMLWNTQIIDTCIVFPQWHIRSNTGFFISFLAIVALGVFYEWLRASARSFDRRVALKFVDGKGKGRVSHLHHHHHPDQDAITSRSSFSSPPNGGREEEEGGDGELADESTTLLTGQSVFYKTSSVFRVPHFERALRALLYGASVFLSFFLMLVFMTYNAYLIIAVVLGASLGHYYLGSEMNIDSALFGEDKGMACH